MIRIGRRIGNKDPTYPGFTKITVMMKSHSKWYPLSPYYLRDSNEVILENAWQFAKVYRKVPASVQRYSQYDPRIIWSHPAEVHLDDLNQPNTLYFQWREKGMKSSEAVRYPVGFSSRHQCLYALDEDGQRLDYIEARKRVYLVKYIESVKKSPLFAELLKRHESGENLLIVEVDGPHQESLQYYIDKYAVNTDFIQQDSVLATERNLEILLNDEKHPFGHGYCLAWTLKGFNFKV